MGDLDTTDLLTTDLLTTVLDITWADTDLGIMDLDTPMSWGTSQHPLKLRLKMFEGASQYSICVFNLAWSKQHFLMYNVQHILVEFCLEQETFGWRYFPRLSET